MACFFFGPIFWKPAKHWKIQIILFCNFVYITINFSYIRILELCKDGYKQHYKILFVFFNVSDCQEMGQKNFFSNIYITFYQQFYVLYSCHSNTANLLRAFRNSFLACFFFGPIFWQPETLKKIQILFCMLFNVYNN